MIHKYAVEQKTISEKEWHRFSWHVDRSEAERVIEWHKKYWPGSIVEYRIVKLGE